MLVCVCARSDCCRSILSHNQISGVLDGPTLAKLTNLQYLCGTARVCLCVLGVVCLCVLCVVCVFVCVYECACVRRVFVLGLCASFVYVCIVCVCVYVSVAISYALFSMIAFNSLSGSLPTEMFSLTSLKWLCALSLCVLCVVCVVCSCVSCVVFVWCVLCALVCLYMSV